MEVNKVVYNGRTLVDLTNDTVAPETLAEGVTAHDASGREVTGIMPVTTVLYTPQSLTEEQKAQARTNQGVVGTVTPQDYGAKGNGTTDDTAAFQNALANNRVVFVPGGTYKLSGELVIRDNCQLEFAQDAVLNFAQTSGNCISMKMSASIVGNHATISVPYTFSGKVINIDGGLNSRTDEVPPFTKWDPMFKSARYITDLNIVKPDTRGFYYSMDGKCSGIAVYLCADASDPSTFIWGADLARLRICGAFTYGVFAESFRSGEDGWIHQLRLDAFIDGAEVALYFKNIEHAYAAVKVLPRRAYTTTGEYIPYAKWGICLENSRDINLLGSRVMDWDSTYSLWTEGGINQHIALIGNCKDVKLEDHHYHGRPDYDIRSLIYTDTPENLESVSILEEPITRWFKPVEGIPCFDDGFTQKQLATTDNIQEIVDGQRVSNFTNVLSAAIDTDGTVFNGIGYAKYGYRLNADGSVTAYPYCGCTGFIPVKQNDVIYVKGFKIPDVLEADGGTYGWPVVVSYDSSFAVMAYRTGKNIKTEDYFFKYEAEEDGFKLTVKQRSTVAYVRFGYSRENMGNYPVISINNEITYSQIGYLQDGIKVKPENVEGLSEILGSYINDIDALLGGG
jgi:hypothetical protein